MRLNVTKKNQHETNHLHLKSTRAMI